jgi:hypothetical protein
MIISPALPLPRMRLLRYWGASRSKRKRRFCSDDYKRMLVVADSLVARQDSYLKPDRYERPNIDQIR